MQNIEKRANGKLYMLRLLKRYGVPRHDLLTVFTGYIRPLAEYAAPVWSGALTNNEKLRIERIQKRALRIVFGTSYTTYEQVLSHCTLQSLEERRQLLVVRSWNRPLIKHVINHKGN